MSLKPFVARLLVVCALSACHAAHAPEQGRASAARHCEPFADVDHLLYSRRAALCHELGAVPAGSSDAAPDSGLPKDSPGVLRACEGGNATACFWAADHAARGFELGTDGRVLERKPPDPERGRELYRKSCELGDDNGCLWLAGQLRDARPEELAPFLLALCSGERSAACTHAIYTLPPAQQPAELRLAVQRLKQRLEQQCLSGSGESCALRDELDEQEQVAAKARRFRLEACRRGVAFACVAAHLPVETLDAVRELSEHACRSNADCPGLLAALHQACRAGNLAACYLTANACKSDELLPMAIECNPAPVARCAAPEEPKTLPPSCVPRHLRGGLLLDERARGIAEGWRVYQSCPEWGSQRHADAQQRGYLFEHVGEVAASPEQMESLLETHRGALHVGSTYATGLSAGGPTGMIEGDVRIEKVLPQLKRGFSDVPSELCFSVQIDTWGSPPVLL
ncbi:MAG TPA: hypothetical protein VFK05_28890 [Polyangiaceae bacterium]|nr:hypothetical protein [Polyangiaceae bacterium]